MCNELIGYINIYELDEYVSSNFISSETLKNNYNILSIEDKIIYLRQSLNIIEDISYYGCKYNDNQKLQFPRAGISVSIDMQLKDVKKAQIEQVISFINNEDKLDSEEYI